MTPREEYNFYATIRETVGISFSDYQPSNNYWPETEQIIDLLSRYIAIAPESVDAYFLRAGQYEYTKEYIKADSDYESILTIAPNRFDIMICYWLPLLFKLKRFQKAISILIDRLQIEKEAHRIAYIHLRIGLVYHKIGRFKYSELHFKLSEQFREKARLENGMLNR